jgi:hypothetical protein
VTLRQSDLLSLRKKQGPGVDAVITIFCEKIGVFLRYIKTNVMIHFSQNSAKFLSEKRHFSPVFYRKYFKNHNNGQAMGSCAIPRFKVCLLET